MIDRRIKPVDLTGMTDDEIHNIGKGFLRALEAVLDKYNPYFGNHLFFEKLFTILNFIKAQLEKEERNVE